MTYGEFLYVSQKHLDIEWKGPFDWPEPREDSPLRKMQGVYMWTTEGPSGYVIYLMGVTRRAIGKRLSEHRRSFLQGKYTILDVSAWRKGTRKEIWHGMWAGHNSTERKAEFKRQKIELQEHARAHMRGTAIFVAEVTENRLQHRIEASYMQALYEAEKPYCNLPDRGMSLAPRRKSETPIVVTNHCNCPFVNLPKMVEI